MKSENRLRDDASVILKEKSTILHFRICSNKLRFEEHCRCKNIILFLLFIVQTVVPKANKKTEISEANYGKKLIFRLVKRKLSKTV